MNTIFKSIEMFIFRILVTSKFLKILILKIAQKIRIYEQILTIKEISPNKIVLNGPFKGLIYPKLESTGSTLLPKILGSYEDELHEVIEKICNNNYEKIVDVGCAEGFYAIGFARRVKSATIYAYDTNPIALQMCSSMAISNLVDNRVMISSLFDSNELINFDFGQKGLVFCDCEGFEIELFTKKTIESLKKVDILVELHDCFNDKISETLFPLFEKTHKLTIVRSRRNKKIEEYPALNKIKNLEDSILSERLDVLMRWAFWESLNNEK